MGGGDIIDELGKQNGVCNTCHTPISIQEGTAYMDHNHDAEPHTKSFRAFLCQSCNLMEGFVRSGWDYKTAASNLEQHLRGEVTS